MSGLRQLAVCAATLMVAGATLGCASIVQRTGILLFYREASHPAELTRLDVAYASPPGEADPKQYLDVFEPAPGGEAPAGGRPTLIFVHGGGWTEGDRAQVAGGADLVRNIGRFYAGQGLAAVVISYRLQPAATWQQQVEDVGRAVRWVRDHAHEWGGDPEAIFLSGHSAGAHLSARFALDPAATRAAGADVCGLVLVSGAAYDLSDAETYRLGANREWFEARFRGEDGGGDWERRASVVPLVEVESPPALILYASGEPEKLRRQSDLLAEAYLRAGASVRRVVVPGEDHQRIVLTLSRDDKTSAPAILDFVRSTECAGRSGGR